MLRPRPYRVAALVFVLVLAAVAFAGTSVKLGAVFPGWDRLRTGNLHDDAAALARDYGRQIGHVCTFPEVFLRDRSSTIRAAELFYESYLPFGSRETMLLETSSQRVSLVVRSTSRIEVLSVMVVLRSAGVVLVLC